MFAELWCTVSPRFPPTTAWYVWSVCTYTLVSQSHFQFIHSIINCTRTCISYLHIKPPLSHFLRESVFSGNSNSGRCSTSTRTDSSAWTNGRKRSSRADTMSFIVETETSLMFAEINWHVEVQTYTQSIPAASQWCSCSPAKPSPRSLCGRHCEQTISSSWLSSAQCCWISQTGCSPGCPGPQGWLLLCFSLGNTRGHAHYLLIWTIKLGITRCRWEVEETLSYRHQRELWYNSRLSPSGLAPTSGSDRPETPPATTGQRLAAWSERKTKQSTNGDFLLFSTRNKSSCLERRIKGPPTTWKMPSCPI